MKHYVRIKKTITEWTEDEDGNKVPVEGTKCTYPSINQAKKASRKIQKLGNTMRAFK